MSENSVSVRPDARPDLLTIGPGDVLVLIDFQVDFLPGGSLPVPHADRLVPVLNRYVSLFESRGLPVVFTRDWHPEGHRSFTPQGGPWPRHCVADTPGARFAEGLAIPCNLTVFSKGTTPESNSYSDFDEAGFEVMLRRAGCRRLFIGGVATEYCVQATVLDALARDFEVTVLVDATGAIDVEPGDGLAALTRMREAGADLASIGSFP